MAKTKNKSISDILLEAYEKGDETDKLVIKKFLEKALFELGSVSNAIALMEEEKK